MPSPFHFASCMPLKRLPSRVLMAPGLVVKKGRCLQPSLRAPFVSIQIISPPRATTSPHFYYTIIERTDALSLPTSIIGFALAFTLCTTTIKILVHTFIAAY